MLVHYFFFSLLEAIESVDLDNFDDFDYESLVLMDVFCFYGKFFGQEKRRRFFFFLFKEQENNLWKKDILSNFQLEETEEVFRLMRLINVY